MHQAHHTALGVDRRLGGETTGKSFQFVPFTGCFLGSLWEIQKIITLNRCFYQKWSGSFFLKVVQGFKLALSIRIICATMPPTARSLALQKSRSPVPASHSSWTSFSHVCSIFQAPHLQQKLAPTISTNNHEIL